MTLRQKRLAKNLGKSRTLEQALLKSEYAPSTAHQQSNVTTKSKGWQQLLDQFLPDEELLAAPRDALKADKVIALPDEPNVVMPDHAIRLKASEQGFKLKGKFAPEQMNTFNVGEMNVQFREKE